MIAVGGEARRPALAHLLVHPLQHFRPEIVAVILGNRRHHVERERSGGTGAELVIDERQLDAAAVFEFLKADGVSHVAADAVELVAQDRLDLLLLRVGLHPGEHLVECDAFRTAFGGLGHDKLADDVPPVGLRPFAVHAKLSIERIAFFLLAGGYPRPHDDVHVLRFSSSARNRTSASLRTFVRISMASSSLITRP